MRTSYKCFHIDPESLVASRGVTKMEEHRLYQIVNENGLSEVPMKVAISWSKYDGTIYYSLPNGKLGNMVDFSKDYVGFFEVSSRNFLFSWRPRVSIGSVMKNVKRFMSCPLFITKLTSLALYEEERN